MRICIEKAPVMNALNNLEDALRVIKAIPVKRRVVIMDCLKNDIESLPEIDPDYVDPDAYVVPETEMIEELEPIIPYGSIGKSNYYCQNCKTRVKKKDRFCRGCGYKFRKDDENG